MELLRRGHERAVYRKWSVVFGGLAAASIRKRVLHLLLCIQCLPGVAMGGSIELPLGHKELL
ncbi:hypothetical protein DNK06_16270 [Pseudomonas daroniae]|uniref:Uncharacterized protein n=1 Tax=Phytopseudomonas daroniae TaxID=2487519 RepID=A0A4V2KAJ8_9GAMM|nr:hypothetical protein DNK10_10690 [Pseudomonas daroniae]TBU76843.1 hypothetical protein DNK06_16270 [Pseudomonas daroniae]TBU81414.1 hypothetical protein DNK31_14985 [Pseudomonas sp. FRB 228]TBU90380.1 hypothetical protein DNJ99_13110 [Pseudomonas daroniae]